MKYLPSTLSLLALAFSIALTFPARAQYAVPHSVVGNGGASVGDNQYRLTGTIGQPVVGIVSNSSNSNKIGFWYLSGDFVTSVEQASNSLPVVYRLEQNYPNPFNPSTSIQFDVPKLAEISMTIFDILGKQVRVFNEALFPAGSYTLTWDARDDLCQAVASGVYLYRLQAKTPGGTTTTFTAVKKMTLIR